MLTYLLIYIVSTILFWGASKEKRCWNLYSIGAILLLGLFAGWRDKYTGSDTATYYAMIDIIDKSNASIWEYLSENIEIAYYLISKFALWINCRWIVLFFYQAIAVSCIYWVAYYYKKHIPVWLVMWLYLCLIFPYSLNIMRQVTAMAYVLAISNYLIKGEQKNFWLAAISSVIFHVTAFIGCLFVWYIYNMSFNGKFSKVTKFSIFIIMLGCVYISFANLVPLLSLFGIPKLSEYVLAYGNLVGKSSYVSISDLLFRIAILCCIWILPVSRLVQNRMIFPYILLVIFEMFLFILGQKMELIFRIAFYLTTFHLILLPLVISKSKLSPVSYSIAYFLVGLGSFGYWWWVFVHNGTNEIVPYKMI